MNEKRERFEKVATKRVDAILKNLDLLSNCSNKYAYEYTQDDIDKIFKTISRHFKSCKNKFDSPPRQTFKL